MHKNLFLGDKAFLLRYNTKLNDVESEKLYLTEIELIMNILI